MPTLISFRGPLGAGKTSAALYTVETFDFTRIAFADPLKVEVYDVLNEGYFKFPEGAPKDAVEAFSAPITLPSKTLSDAEKREFINKHKKALRPLLQWYGTEYRRGQDPEYWLKQFHRAAKASLDAGNPVVVDDTRFDNEVKLIKRLGGYDVLIEASDEQIQQNLKARDGKVVKGLSGHASEAYLDIVPDHTIYNDGDLDKFHKNINGVVSKILSNPSPPRSRNRRTR